MFKIESKIEFKIEFKIEAKIEAKIEFKIEASLQKHLSEIPNPIRFSFHKKQTYPPSRLSSLYTVRFLQYPADLLAQT